MGIEQFSYCNNSCSFRGLTLVVLGWQSLSKVGVSQNYQPAQPISFLTKYMLVSKA